MSKKIAILSAIMLIMGGVSIPGGIVINNVINDMVTDRIDDGLLGIQEQFVPIAEDMILEMGPAIALQQIKDLAVPAGIPLAQASFLTQVLYNSYDIGYDTLGSYGGKGLIHLFFDQISIDFFGPMMQFSTELKDNGIPNANGQYIYGISEWYNMTYSGGDLNIGDYNNLLTSNPNDWLAWGSDTPNYPTPVDKEINDPPGFMQHTKLGFGILDFLKNFTNANQTGTQAAKDVFCAPYEVDEEDIPFWKMEVVYNYFYDYWVPEAMPLLLADLQNASSPFTQFAPEYVYMDIEDIAYYEFLKQWINYSTYVNGVDFHNFAEDLPPGMHGLEVDSPTISVGSLYALWDEWDEWSFLNITGIGKWLAANSNIGDKQDLEDHFNLTSQEAQDILDWLWNGPDSFSQGVLPYLIESELGYGMSISDLAKRVMLEQWANGTSLGMNLFEGGIDFSEFITSLPEGSTGFEVGVPKPTGMSIESAELLWDTSNPYSLVKDISVWWSITSKDSEMYATVRDANKLDDETMDMILNWLPNFRNNLMPALAQYEMNLPMDTTNLGNTIQIGGIIIGAVSIGLASTGFVSNRIYIKRKEAIYKADKIKKRSNKIMDDRNMVSRSIPDNLDPRNRPVDTKSEQRDEV